MRCKVIVYSSRPTGLPTTQSPHNESQDAKNEAKLRTNWKTIWFLFGNFNLLISTSWISMARSGSVLPMLENKAYLNAIFQFSGILFENPQSQMFMKLMEQKVEAVDQNWQKSREYPEWLEIPLSGPDRCVNISLVDSECILIQHSLSTGVSDQTFARVAHSDLVIDRIHFWVQLASFGSLTHWIFQDIENDRKPLTSSPKWISLREDWRTRISMTRIRQNQPDLL